MRQWQAVVVACAIGAGCGSDDDASPPRDARACVPNGIVFLNDEGGDYTAGSVDDSVSDVSQIIRMDLTLEEWSRPQLWAELVACFREGLSQFNIEVVEADPGAVDHTEMVFTGTRFLAPGVSSVSAHVCPAAKRPIAFVFDAGSEDVEFTCWASLQQWAVATVSLDHALWCEDYMTHLMGCGPKTWVDEEVPCGEASERSCRCGGVTQNSFETLMDTFGPACQ